MSQRRIGILHPGAMGVSIALSAKEAGCAVYWASEGRRTFTAARASEAGLSDAGTVARLCEVCPVIVSVCPPEFAFEVARRVADAGFSGIFADVNALAPDNKIQLGREMQSREVRFVDGGIIGLPSRVPGETTVFLSGEAAADVAAYFEGGAIRAAVLGPEVGRATALKILFAAYNKGSIALLATLYAAARRYGVLEDLKGQFVHRGLSLEKIDAQIVRAAPKAWRWVPEMHEISDALQDVGMPGEFHLGAAKLYEMLKHFKDKDPGMDEILHDLAPGA